MEKKSLSTADLEKAIDFFEEFVWLFESKRNVKLKNVPNELRNIINNNHLVSSYVENSTPDSNVHFLIGVLPGLFQDEKLFPTNTQIANFAEQVLNIKVTRASKRSKYELIGLIICRANNLSDSQLQHLVQSLNILIRNNDTLESIRNIEKTDNFSWNETIQRLTGV